MAYYFIVPLYALFLAGVLASAAVARGSRSWRGASGYLLGGALGSLAGFLAFNALVVLGAAVPAWLARRVTLPDWMLYGGEFLMGAYLIVAPFLASAFGTAAGFAVGLYLVFVRRQDPGRFPWTTA